MNKINNKSGAALTAAAAALSLAAAVVGAPISSMQVYAGENGKEKTVTLRISNWEEYIDEGDWDEDELIDLESGDIIGENNLIDDFEEWYYDTYGINVKVEYSTFGTNEDLYNMLTLGDVYDLICPSEYMFMKLMEEEKLVPLSEEFFDTSDPNNYYSIGVSPYIKEVFDNGMIGDETWSKYAAGYMWGLTGIVYNPEYVTEEEASTWRILDNSKFKRQITIKDNVRDSYFAAVGALKGELLTSEEFVSDPNYHENLEREMNDTSPETIQLVQDYLQGVKDNVYSFETDSGKADMITGKVVANYQWSGDAAYTMEQTEEDGLNLAFAIPEESTNIYFDGWVMLKSGISEDADKQHAAEAFINFVSRPDNVVRNMYYVGYTSVISGGDDTRIFEYADWNFGAEEDEEDTVEYDIGYFWGDEEESGDYVVTVPAGEEKRQIFAQYPSQDAIERSSVMTHFSDEQNQAINQMWIHVRCFNIEKVPTGVWLITIVIILALAGALIYRAREKRH